MTLEVTVSLLVIALILFVLFGGLGFLAHVLWWGLIIALGLALFHVFAGRSGTRA